MHPTDFLPPSSVLRKITQALAGLKRRLFGKGMFDWAPGQEAGLWAADKAIVWGHIAVVRRGAFRTTILVLAEHAIVPDTDVVVFWTGAEFLCTVHYCVRVGVEYGITAKLQRLQIFGDRSYREAHRELTSRAQKFPEQSPAARVYFP